MQHLLKLAYQMPSQGLTSTWRYGIEILVAYISFIGAVTLYGFINWSILHFDVHDLIFMIDSQTWCLPHEGWLSLSMPILLPDLTFVSFIFCIDYFQLFRISVICIVQRFLLNLFCLICSFCSTRWLPCLFNGQLILLVRRFDHGCKQVSLENFQVTELIKK